MDSDKVFWHQYIPEYERMCFSKLEEEPKLILEYGVLHGASITWLANRFPTARIVGFDIVKEQPALPKSERISYVQGDQGSVESIIGGLITTTNNWIEQIDLVIEDGSHDPYHQAQCLVQTIQFMKEKSYYILEDAHTSHPSNHLGIVTIVNILLAIQHLKKTHQPLTDEILKSLSTASVLIPSHIFYLFNQINSIQVYKRTVLPLWCWRCSQADFDYATLRCICGEELYKEADSMAFILGIR